MRMKNKDAIYWVNKGDEFYIANNYEEAIMCYENAIQLNPKDAYAFNNWGHALHQLSEIKKDDTLLEHAIEKCDESIRLDSTNDVAFSNCGNILYQLARIKQEASLFECAIKKYDDAIMLNPNNAHVFYNCGLALNCLAEIKQSETLFERTFECYHKSTQLDPTNVWAFCNWGHALCCLAIIKKNESLFEDAFEVYDKAVQLDPNNAYALNNWGIALSILAEIRHDETLFKSAFDKYNKFMQLDQNDTLVFFNYGLALYRLAEIKQDESLYKESVNYFKKSKRDILSIFAAIYKNDNKPSFQTELFYPLLDLSDTNNTLFFTKITKNIKKDNTLLNKYKNIYLRAIFIICLLHVNNPNEKCVAHYREKDVSQKIILKNDSTFRLNAIDNSNDPSEGMALLTFLYDAEKHQFDEDLNTEYEAFAGCFTFDYNNLNLFRLYGKDGGKEGTGLSLVFRDDFFSMEAKTAFESLQVDSFKINLAVESPQTDHNNVEIMATLEKDKLALFRCIYIDPNPQTKQPIVTVGQKEEYLFYREECGNNFEEYNNEMRKIVVHVRKEMDELKKLATELNPTIVGQLLLHLRYLVKHVAFKEEQECRIVKILHLHDKNIKVDDDLKQMYINYAPSVPMYLDKIYFGPKATGIELFRSMLKNKKLNIPCEQSKNPLA
jgi:tetratricopeptide (TPR) repeat protein